jgi:hypothetical protein
MSLHCPIKVILASGGTKGVKARWNLNQFER